MQARYYDPVIGRFLSNDPVGFADRGWQYFNRYSYTFNDPVNMTDPTGMAADPCRDCRMAETSQRSGDTEMPTTPVEHFANNYLAMREANVRGADKFFHCRANCAATRATNVGELEATIISDVRELVDQYLGGDPASAAAEDQLANRAGRLGARTNPQASCSAVCAGFIPNGLDTGYTEGEVGDFPANAEIGDDEEQPRTPVEENG